MRPVAGIDVGNATTEVVLADADAVPPEPLARDRAPTRGAKGSERSLRGALDLLRRVEDRAGLRAGLVAMAPQEPVLTRGTTIDEPAPDTGRIALLAAGSPTPGGAGLGVGRPVHAESAPDQGAGPVVLVATDPLGFRATAAAVRTWSEAGAEVVAVLLAGDEATLVAARISAAIPVVDGIDAVTALRAGLLAVEVAEAGRAVRRLSDPVALAALLGLGADEHRHAEAVAASVRGARDAAIALVAAPMTPAGTAPGAPSPWVAFADGARAPLLEGLVRLRGVDAPLAVGCALPDSAGTLAESAVGDLWGVDLTALADDSLLRPGARRSRSVALALLGMTDGAAGLALLDPRIAVVGSEATAARAGALTTPGADPGAAVIDIGAGTIDVVTPDGSARVLAGAGELLTTGTALVLGITAGQAEWVKRGPCARVESPHLMVDEDGTRRFLDAPAPTGSVGWLTVPGPAGTLPFDRTLSPAEWRGLRLRLKQAAIGDNVARSGLRAGEVIAVGGPAGDDELLDVLARALRGTVPGRGDVAGRLGHRFAVAYGLVVLAAVEAP